MQSVRFGVIGLGNMGSVHCANLAGNVENASLAVICDSDPKRLAAAARKAGVTQVVFDRGGFLFHGRVKALAEAAREGGLEF